MPLPCISLYLDLLLQAKFHTENYLSVNNTTSNAYNINEQQSGMEVKKCVLVCVSTCVILARITYESNKVYILHYESEIACLSV